MKDLKYTQIQFVISFILSASQMFILNPSRYKREGTEGQFFSMFFSKRKGFKFPS